VNTGSQVRSVLFEAVQGPDNEAESCSPFILPIPGQLVGTFTREVWRKNIYEKTETPNDRFELLGLVMACS
jgi:hypothetical protein